MPRLDEEAEWNVVLSGGEQQRVALARALFRRPDVLLLDDAVSNFDEATARELYRILLNRLPETIVISIGKPALLGKLHRRKIDLDRAAEAEPVVAAMSSAPA